VEDDDAREAYVESVLSLVEQVPEGRATTYGVIADAVGTGGPRQVGRVMAMYGSPVPWWRVVRADGSLPESHQREALPHYRQEETPLRGSITDAAHLRVDLPAALWIPDDFAD
jgi:alkylated DNA nucleotide flippase Atl1